MTKFDHRLKRLEGKAGLNKKHFDYWTVLAGKGQESPAKVIQDIEAGLIIGKMGSRFNPESQNVIIVSAVPRINDKALRSRGELYKILERKVGLRIDPENYKPPVIIRNFMLLWIRNKSDEELKAAQGEKLVALTRDEVEQVMSNEGRRSRIAPVSDEENDEAF